MSADWSARARREAAAILAEAAPLTRAEVTGYETILSLIALGWLQGVNYGSHETLGLAEAAFQRLQEDVTA